MRALSLPEGWVSWEIDPIRPGARRTVDELLFGRGRLTAAIASKRVVEQTPGSPVRRKLLTSAIRAGFALTNRLEYDKLMRGYWDDCELHFEEGAGVGLQNHAVGHAEVRTFLEQFDEVFGQRHHLPREVVDPGGPLVGARVTTEARAIRSGVEINPALWYVWRMDAGKVRHQVLTSDREVFFRALGGG